MEIGGGGQLSELTHYGVKGMRWGVRKRIQSLRNNPRYYTRRRRQRERLKSMSNSDLQAYLNRKRMEVEYHRLQEPSNLAKAGKIAGQFAIGLAAVTARKKFGKHIDRAWDAGEKKISESVMRQYRKMRRS